VNQRASIAAFLKLLPHAGNALPYLTEDVHAQAVRLAEFPRVFRYGLANRAQKSRLEC
jgi:hypothetical protein